MIFVWKDENHIKHTPMGQRVKGLLYNNNRPDYVELQTQEILNWVRKRRICSEQKVAKYILTLATATKTGDIRIFNNKQRITIYQLLRENSQ